MFEDTLTFVQMVDNGSYNSYTPVAEFVSSSGRKVYFRGRYIYDLLPLLEAGQISGQFSFAPHGGSSSCRILKLDLPIHRGLPAIDSLEEV